MSTIPMNILWPKNMSEWISKEWSASSKIASRYLKRIMHTYRKEVYDY